MPLTLPRVTSPAPGWYPDPSGRPGERWWNGGSWTDDVRETQNRPAQPATQVDAPHGWDGFGNPAAPPAAPPPAYNAPPRYATAAPPQRSWVKQNGYSLATVGVVIAYLLVLAFAGIVFLGILPIFMAYSAVQRKEPLRWAAVGIAVIAIVFAIYELAR